MGACGSNDDDDSSKAKESPGASADSLARYKEGSELPADWPENDVPVPSGATVVASISKATVADQPGEASTVLYLVTQTPQEIHDFMAAELPKKGWTLLEASTPADTGFSVTSAEGNGYIAVFTAGEGIAPADVADADKVTLQIILAKAPPAGEASPEGSPKG
ncbi:MAG: hypothetical protein WD627_05885 [Actinomycetota bacterium]